MLPTPQPPAGDETSTGSSSERVQDLLDFVIRYETDRARGDLLALAEYQDLFPRSRAAIEAEFLRLQSSGGSPDEWTQDPTRLDHYVLEREIGYGGQGRVFLALDTRMRRRVALKVLSRSSLSPDTLRRFQREVEIIAKLDHPGLCSVYEANLNGRRPYLAMRYVEGDDLARLIRKARAKDAQSGAVGARTAVDLARLLQLFERAARALHAAHEAGVLHRDVKPANILVHASGEPVIVDFGLARDEDPEADPLTRTNDVLGTPAYMAPELLDSSHSSVDRRADVYALGVALYECLTLERPFAGATREGVFDQIRRGTYANPRERNPLVGEDLRVVLATAMELDPGRRYSSALDLAEDLRRVREYEPIRARPAGWPIRLRRWAQRHPQLAVSLALFVAVVGTSLAMLTATVRRVEAQSARTRAANARLLGVAFRERSEAVLRADAGLALRFAIEADQRDPCFESNMSLLRALAANREERSLAPAGWRPEATIYTAGLRGDRAVTVTSDGLQIFDVDDSRPRSTTPVRMASPRGLQVSPDGARIAVLERASVHVFDGRTGAALYKFTHGATAESCQFSADGRWLVTSARNGVACVLDAGDGRLVRSLTPGTGMMTLALFDPSGRFIVTASDVRTGSNAVPPTDFDPRLWDAASGDLVAVLPGTSSGVRGAEFTADGARVLTVGIDGAVSCWTTADARLAWRRELPGPGWSLGVSPDGRRVVAGFECGARVFDTAAGEASLDLEGLHERAVMNVAYSPDGRTIAANDYGGGIGAWSASDGSRQMAARCESTSAGGIAWLPDSTRFLTWAGRAVAHVWTTRPVPLLASWHAHAGRVSTCVFSPSGERVLSAGEDGRIELRDAADGRSILTRDLGAPQACAWFVGDDDSLACLARDGRVQRIDRAMDPAACVAGPARTAVSSCVPARDGATLLAGFVDGRVAWIDARDGRTLFESRDHEVAVEALAISPDGRRAAWCSGDGHGGAVDRVSGRTFAFWIDPSAQNAHALALDLDGSRILASSDASTVTRIRFDDGGREDSHRIRPLAAIVPLHGGRMLTAFKWVAGLSLLDEAPEKEVWSRAHYGERGLFVTMRVDAREERALGASTAGFACLWRVDTGELLVRYEHGDSALTCAEFRPDGGAVVTAAADGSVHVWPVDLRATALEHVPAPAEVWQSRFPKPLEDE